MIKPSFPRSPQTGAASNLFRPFRNSLRCPAKHAGTVPSVPDTSAHLPPARIRKYRFPPSSSARLSGTPSCFLPPSDRQFYFCPRPVPDTKCLPLPDIPHTPDSLDIGMPVILDLCPKPVYRHGKRVVIDEIPVTIPQPFQQNLSGNDIT